MVAISVPRRPEIRSLTLLGLLFSLSAVTTFSVPTRSAPSFAQPARWHAAAHRRNDGPSASSSNCLVGDELVVIKYYASWCRACKALGPKVEKIARAYKDKRVAFYELEFETNKEMCKRLGIKVLPWIEIFSSSAGKLESFSCGPSKASQIVEKLKIYLNGECPLGEDGDATDPAAPRVEEESETVVG